MPKSEAAGLSDIAVIIRSAGERTAAACRGALLQQGVGADCITTLREAPFSKALRMGFEAGIASGRPWILCVDADVVLRPGAAKALLRHARRSPPKVFKVQSFMLDKFTLSFRSGGAHLYRASHLQEMIGCIADEGATPRPEGHAATVMRSRGYGVHLVPYVVGIHDFHQFNRDIFRKCYAHARKHLHYLPWLIPAIRSRAEDDPDFEMALHGFAEGLKDRGWVPTDTRYRPFSERFEALNLPEKDERCRLTSEAAEEVLQDWALAPDVRVRGWPMSAPELLATDGTSEVRRLDWFRALLRQRRREVGLAGFIPFVLGAGLEQLGRRIKSPFDRSAKKRSVQD